MVERSGVPGKNDQPGANATPWRTAVASSGAVSLPSFSVTQQNMPPAGRVTDAAGGSIAHSPVYIASRRSR